MNSRRTFLKNTSLFSAAMAFPNILTHGLGSAGEKVNLACIGIGNQGGSDVMSFAKTGLVNFVAFCDVDMGCSSNLGGIKKIPRCAAFSGFQEDV
jgi:hypothetical protein